MAVSRRAEVTWEGDLMKGSGTVTASSSRAFGPLPVTWASRTEAPEGKTSPEELIAAAHAKGIKVFSDALGQNETVEQYRKAIGWGIDVIQTDHPLRVLRAIELESAARR